MIYSALQHALNLVFAIGELMLSSIPYHAYLMGFMGLYTAVYGLCAFNFYRITGRWIYPVSPELLTNSEKFSFVPPH